jgi:maltose-binding protein MalE
MVAPRGFSINVNVTDEKLPLLIDLLRFLMRPDVQLETTRALWTMPTRREVVESEFVRTDDIDRNSKLQIERGRLMPMVPELRAIWDAMRPSYQGVLGGSMTPEAAARAMQDLAVRKIKEMNE